MYLHHTYKEKKNATNNVCSYVLNDSNIQQTCLSIIFYIASCLNKICFDRLSYNIKDKYFGCLNTNDE